MKKRSSSGLQNDAADKIWNDHLGNNAFVKHRDQCSSCLAAYEARGVSDALKRAGYGGEPQRITGCPEGERIFDEMLDAVCAQMDEVMQNQN